MAQVMPNQVPTTLTICSKRICKRFQILKAMQSNVKIILQAYRPIQLQVNKIPERQGQLKRPYHSPHAMHPNALTPVYAFNALSILKHLKISRHLKLSSLSFDSRRRSLLNSLRRRSSRLANTISTHPLLLSSFRSGSRRKPCRSPPIRVQNWGFRIFPLRLRLIRSRRAWS